jgi:hypothetical protein
MDYDDFPIPYIFISYRRADSQHITGRIYDFLRTDWAEVNIFRDVNTLSGGEIFTSAIEEAVRSCRVFLAIIGDLWLTASDSKGRRRLDNPNDLVRKEVAIALSRENVLVIPILVNGAALPLAEDLPADLKPLRRHNALELRERDFDYDISKLLKAINRTIPLRERVQTATREGNITYQQALHILNMPLELQEKFFDEAIQDVPARKRLLDEMRTETVKLIINAFKEEENSFHVGCIKIERQKNQIKAIIQCSLEIPRKGIFGFESKSGWYKNTTGQYEKKYPQIDLNDREVMEHQFLEITTDLIEANENVGVPPERVWVYPIYAD